MNFIKNILKKLGIFNLMKNNFDKIKIVYINIQRSLNSEDRYCTVDTKRCLENKSSVKYQYQLFGEDSPICCNTHLYELLRDITNVLENYNITHFINYGTFLGAVRHKGIIPWDTDVDIGILSKDLDNIETVLVEELGNKYFIIKENDSYLKVYISKENSIHIDFDIWIDKGKYLEFHGDIYCGTRIMTKDIIFPLKKYKFYDLEIYGPKSTEFLNIVYGNDYMTVGYKKWGLKSNKVKISDNAIPAKIDRTLLRN